MIQDILDWLSVRIYSGIMDLALYFISALTDCVGWTLNKLKEKHRKLEKQLEEKLQQHLAKLEQGKMETWEPMATDTKPADRREPTR